MLFRKCLVVSTAFFIAASLSGCALTRDDKAHEAKMRMVGMTKEEVLACMGPAKKKATEGSTEVWSYLSTDGEGTYDGTTFGLSSYNKKTHGTHYRNFCTVNVVMKDGVVTAIHYLGPSDTYLFTTYDQCGYAVADCVGHRGDE